MIGKCDSSLAGEWMSALLVSDTAPRSDNKEIMWRTRRWVSNGIIPPSPGLPLLSVWGMSGQAWKQSLSFLWMLRKKNTKVIHELCFEDWSKLRNLFYILNFSHKIFLWTLPSGIRVGKLQIQHPGSKMNIPDFIFDNLASAFWL